MINVNIIQHGISKIALHCVHLVAVHVDPESVGVARVVEQQQRREQRRAELLRVGRGHAGQGGVSHHPAHLCR